MDNQKSTKYQVRQERLMPNGIPKYVRIWDKPECADRYTVIFSGNYRKKRNGQPGQLEQVQVIGMSENPTHPQGFCQHMEYPNHIDTKDGWAPAVGRKTHLGRRITFQDLPKQCQAIIINDYKDIWQLT